MPRISEGALLEAYSKLKIVANDLCIGHGCHAISASKNDFVCSTADMVDYVVVFQKGVQISGV